MKRLGPADDFHAAALVGLMGGLGGNLIASGIDNMLHAGWVKGSGTSWSIAGAELAGGGFLLWLAMWAANRYARDRRPRPKA